MSTKVWRFIFHLEQTKVTVNSIGMEKEKKNVLYNNLYGRWYDFYIG